MLIRETPIRGGLVMFAALAVMLAAAVSARAATPVTLGPGLQPGLAVDRAGTAYIAWSGPENPPTLQFCRLPRGARACDVRRAIATPGASGVRPFLVVSGSRVNVISYRYGGDVPGFAKDYLFTSTNGGSSFDAGAIVGNVPFFDAVAGPGTTLSGVTDAFNVYGMVFQNLPLDGHSGPSSTWSVLSPDHPYQGTVAVDGGTPLAVFTTGDDQAQFSRYDGTGGLNVTANWTAPQPLGVARKPRLAGGPGGVFLLAVASDDHTVAARKWSGATFGPAHTVAGGANPPTLAAFEDASGRVHAVFERGDANGLHLIHAVSDDGKAWSSGTAVTQGPGKGGFADPRVATAPDHVGVSVWATAGSAGPQQIRVVRVGPGAPVRAARLARKGKPPAKARRLSAGKVRLVVSGKLGLPGGVSKAQGCHGKLHLTVKRGRKRIATRTLKLGHKTCGYRTRRTLTRKQVKRAKHLTVTLSFPGNASLGRIERSYKIPIRKRG